MLENIRKTDFKISCSSIAVKAKYDTGETGSHTNYIIQHSNFAGKPIRNMCCIGTGSIRALKVNTKIYSFKIKLGFHP